MCPAKWFFNKHENEPTSEVAIRRAPREDLYIVLGGYDVETQQASLRGDVINPLVNWIWFGFARARVRHGHRAAARAGVRVRRWRSAGRGGDDGP